MNKILQEILELLRNNECAFSSIKNLLSSLIETLNRTLSGDVNVIQQKQVESLTQFPSTTNELIDLIRDAIENSKCSIKEKSELNARLDLFVRLVNEYRIANP